MKPMTVLLTGGSGFLGSHIAEQLCQDGCRVRAIVRMTSDTSFLKTLNNIEIIRLSMADTHGVREAVEGVDAIIHSAAVLKATHEETFKKVNVDYTINLLDAVSQTGTKLKRFVHISSLAAVGSSGTGEIIRNDDPATPLTRYGKSKLASEQAAKSRSDHIPITILRPVSLYGPRDRATLTMFNCVKTSLLALSQFTAYPNHASLRGPILPVHAFKRFMQMSLAGHPILSTMVKSTLGKSYSLR